MTFKIIVLTPAMKIPKLSPSPLPPVGHKFVSSKSHKLPLPSGLLNPSTNTTTPINKVANTDKRDVYEMYERGRKAVGIRITRESSL